MRLAAPIRVELQPMVGSERVTELAELVDDIDNVKERARHEESIRDTCERLERNAVVISARMSWRATTNVSPRLVL